VDEARRFRFLVPPFFLLASLYVGVLFSPIHLSALTGKYSTQDLIAFAAAVGASALPIGFLLTSVSILVLRVVGVLAGKRTYEVTVSSEWLDRVWPLMRTRLPCDRRWLLYAAATFDHELLAPPIHEWIQRRWSTFNLSVHSFVAVMLAHLAAPFSSQISESWEWVAVTISTLVIFGANAWIAWRQTMNMLEFQSYRLCLEPR
jgi:hypothetical protein